MNFDVDIYRSVTESIYLICQKDEGIQPIDLIDFVNKVTFHESMNQMFMSGTIEFTVPKGYFGSLGIRVGIQDVLSIKIKSVKSISKTSYIDNDESIQDVFVVNKVSKIDTPGNSILDTYKLNFISKESVKDKRERIQKSFKNKKRSDIIKEIYENNMKSESNLTGNADTDHADFFCVVPNWNPSKTINWLMSGCEADESKNFYFFQRFSTDGKIETVFENFRTLCGQEPSVGLDSKNASGYVSNFDVAQQSNLSNDYFDKARMTVSDPIVMEYDFLQNSINGSLSSRAFFYDITTKKYTKNDYVYKDDGPEPSLPNLKKFITSSPMIETNETYNSPTSSVFLFPKAKFRFDKAESEVGVDRTEQWYQDHISQKEISIANAVVIETAGDTQRRIGETVMFSNFIKDYDSDNSPFQHDEDGTEMGGKYLIFGLERVFEYPEANPPGQGKCLNRMVLVRDGNPI